MKDRTSAGPPPTPRSSGIWDRGGPGWGLERSADASARSQWAESNSETLLTAQKQNVFSVVCTLVQVSQVAAEACEQQREVVLNFYLESVLHFSVIIQE